MLINIRGSHPILRAAAPWSGSPGGPFMAWFSRRDQQEAVPVRELSELDKSLFRASSATELESLISRGANVNADD
ncbi:hypothetical protein [Nocardioides sp. GY 10127]|uniref:hypothetical protein n=1 Tax=Nocardioides sp. GY 10127 TaxID=2569762 RepID=UPI0010A93A42|nr:hypothetical protein [Nocardioides sp. GY 10127]TIC86625.1 hypothetical protein E8D37_01690 [Nocardioides sp. GY 10127]